MDAPFLGFGAGLRTRHYTYILEQKPRIDWFEAIAENYMISGGRPLRILDQIRSRYPVVLHGVSLSIGSADPLNFDYLKKLRELIRRVDPPWVSDHLCWTGVGGHNVHDLLPLPYTDEALRHVVSRIKTVQDFLGRRILIENVSSYMEYFHSTMAEWDFLANVAVESDCHILLDLNNVYVSACNHDFDMDDYLNAMPKERIKQFHLAGHTDKGDYLLDTHDHAVKKNVWGLYKKALDRFGAVATMIERDDKIPPFPQLLKEVNKARTIYEEWTHARTELNLTATKSLAAHHGA